jgi:hypothetical protein
MQQASRSYASSATLKDEGIKPRSRYQVAGR